jgi:hypothetical protein
VDKTKPPLSQDVGAFGRGPWGTGGVTDADTVNERNDQPFHAVRKRKGAGALVDKGKPPEKSAFISPGPFLEGDPHSHGRLSSDENTSTAVHGAWGVLTKHT